MNIKSVRIVEGKLLLMGDDREFYLMDGVYRREDGETITVSDHQIVDVLSIPDLNSATKKQLENYVTDLGNQYKTMTDMSQLSQLQLQDAMNKQQQALQMLSNIMKHYHDTLTAIINNMRA